MPRENTKMRDAVCKKSTLFFVLRQNRNEKSYGLKSHFADCKITTQRKRTLL